MLGLRILGFAIFGYTVYAIVQGRIHSGSRTVVKAAEPDAFWTTVLIYFAASVALCAAF